MGLSLEKLYDEGYCFYNELYSLEFIKKLEDASKSLISMFESKKNLENYNLSIMDIHSQENNMSYLSNSKKVIMQDRRKHYQDNGMVDIFNPQLVNSKSSELFNLFRDKVKESCLSDIEKKYQKKFELGTTNIYQHYKTTKPKLAHYDNEDNYFKLFLYLSDVNTVNGSFFFYRDSHKQKIKKKIMNGINKYIYRKKDLEDINFIFSDKNKIDLKGKIGTTVITDVSGLHGCNPFEINNEMKRLVIVQRIRPKK